MYGRNSDGGVYENSVMGKMCERNQLNVPENTPLDQNSEPMPYTIVADAAFPLKTYLLNPYSKEIKIKNFKSKVSLFQAPMQVSTTGYGRQYRTSCMRPS
jgi:hypothetical protein